MKSQDIFLLFKMASLHAQEESEAAQGPSLTLDFVADRYAVADGLPTRHPDWALFDSSPEAWEEQGSESWEGWDDPQPLPKFSSWAEGYSLRALSASLGLSKSEISNSIGRCREAGLLINDFETSLPRVNRRALLGIAEYALKFFFPVRLGAIVRGIPTGFAAPALAKHLKSAGDLIPVWPDPLGKERGQAIEPLYKSVPEAVKKDRTLYHYLALADAIRVGGPRESKVAVDLLKAGMGL
ncbi:MarR family transcriptional regulator [Pseudomonas nicosulfuronedens]|uniref:MarR family transcriptional regulator n=1 Tax=Pseudomonas nicosulfuronedens TaxID=2571105 RepID=A0A5R9QVK7_9PSED|nr:MarR family transcriptional regulator [Pseudomonas nicosulfuronedens]MDH1009001.1 MarR family transcriptional regulator [Pseudomonas nicosulfuronedens]MDH1977914.1 MarR family transcriptional regulator [Pseudomonas nicosulfuronedens]MDH2028696.1 MarR family transcriptional regulator [Pseudomonas nicosulfuronedens]TLX73400.1 MarR family transcriptional regulator [Pseudomonas nicosulfuronedens]